MISMLEIMAKLQMPWWCYARLDALLYQSDATWRLIRKSRLRMAYIGAESPNGQMLKVICKGTRPDQTLEIAESCRRHGMIPELSFMVAPLLDVNGDPVIFPRSPEEWMQSRGVDYACHADASWLTDKLRRRIQDFVTVLRCRYPTVQDLCSPVWAKRSLSTIAGWRYRQRRYDRPRGAESRQDTGALAHASGIGRLA